MQHVLPLSIRDRLLAEAVARRELSERAVTSVKDLQKRGLSLEQALVGTGLISAQRLSELLSTASGLPSLTLTGENQSFPSGLDRETATAWQIVVQKKLGKSWQIGLTNPWDQDVRSAIEALAVEHGWSPEFCCVLPSVADRWLRVANETRRSSEALARYARALVERADQEARVKIVAEGQMAHPEESVVRAPIAWLPALHRRLARRLQGSSTHVRHHRSHHGSHIELQREQPVRSLQKDEEHPLHVWTDAVDRFFEEGKVVFVLDEQGDLLHHWPNVHVEIPTDEWRSGGRWVSEATSDSQEELFHLSLAGYPGTIRFQSLGELQAWEQAAEAAHVPYAACIGQATPHGIAWSVYSV